MEVIMSNINSEQPQEQDGRMISESLKTLNDLTIKVNELVMEAEQRIDPVLKPKEKEPKTSGDETTGVALVDELNTYNRFLRDLCDTLKSIIERCEL